ncbi:acyl-CoA dehydrogenase family protein [Rhodovarius lipocyclicus]|uniref:acyl-CoA dehydrogenase family protein n=1 Tax=Rhodovarius lipocyclicus TaxID=268410 RepID=UPI001358AA3D|nr:acyl-CoA dehydrogenase family protein [Rhodovarius lipocyclicus]
MDFDLTEDQSLLVDSVRKLLSDKYGFEQRKAYMASERGWSPELWAAFADIGVLGLPFAEEDGGFGAGLTDTCLIAEQFGRSLVVEPWFSTVVIGGAALRHGGSAALRQELVPLIAAGEVRLALAQQERQSRYDLFDVATTAKKSGSGWVISGNKGMVIHGDSATHLIVSARVAGGQRDKAGIGLFVVEAGAPGVTIRGFRTVDGQRAAEIILDNAPAAHVLGDAEAGLPVLEKVAAESIAALAFEAVGCMDVAHAMTLDYMKTREQFGRPIGSFQALQHRAADMLVAIEQARSMSFYAVQAAEETDPDERRRGISAVKVQIGRASRLVGQQSIQLHGGIAMTMEYACGHYFKRLTVNDGLFGNADFHLRALADEGGLVRAA